MFDPDRRHLIAYLAAAAVLLVIAGRLITREGGSEPLPTVSMAAPTSARPSAERPRASARRLIWVDVAGAVRRPGLYSLPEGARVAAALARAGGVRGRANRAAVNLAAKLVDGQQIFVPDRGASAVAAASGAPGSASGGSTSGAPGSGSSAPGSATGGAASGAAEGSSPGARISLASATQAQLEQLDGIGPALAQRIIQYREQHGGFRSIDELQQVSGIGEKRFEALKNSIAP